jgi:hypothetical protein
MSLHRINQLDLDVRRTVYARLVPPIVFDHVAVVDPERFAGGPTNPRTLYVDAPPDLSRVHIGVPATRVGGDYAFWLELEEAGAGQLELAFITINDLASPRYTIDVDAGGRTTLLGTSTRNLVEEHRAMNAGLGPCQVRRGLRALRPMLAQLEAFARDAGYVAIKLEALTYHVAVIYENAGFAYLSGHRRMQQINAAFAPGGVLHAALDHSTPFRSPEHAATPRGRAWAIHDGILERLDASASLKLELVKVVGHAADHRTFTATCDSPAAGLGSTAQAASPDQRRT